MANPEDLTPFLAVSPTPFLRFFGKNGKCPEQLYGLTHSISFNIGFGPVKFSVNYSYDDNGIKILSVAPPGLGESIGASFSSYETMTGMGPW